MSNFKIGKISIKNNLILGPMAGVTNRGFRLICKEFNVGLVYAEMVSIEGIIHNNSKSIKMLNVEDEERPLSMQIFGNNLDSYTEATKFVENNCNCDIIDINMGCPAPKVSVRSQAGASLLNDPNKIGEIVSVVSKMTKKPVTVKLRIGWDESNINILEVAKICEDAGASAIAIHPRTRNQFFKGKSDWDWIRKVKEITSIPIIGNGDIVDEHSAKKMIDETGCDAIMISRAAQGNPWIFSRIDHYLKTGLILEKPSINDIKKIILKHLDYILEEKEELFAVKEMRKFLVWYFNNIPNKSSDINTKAVRVESKLDIINLLEGI